MFASAREVISRPSEHPDRKDGVFVVASSPHGEVLLTLILDRDKEACAACEYDHSLD